MELTPGLRLRSQVCTTEVIVVRPPATMVELTCGGAPLVPLTQDGMTTGTPAHGLDAGTQLGKRYTSDTDGALEVLVTKPGAGTLADGLVPLTMKQAKPLPSSD